MATKKIKISDAITSQTTNADSGKRANLYIDINKQLVTNTNKTDITTNTDVAAIMGSIKNILTYSPGERILRPNFGFDARELLYEQMSDKIAQSIGMKIYNAIKKWEPRIAISNVNVAPDYNDNCYYVTITFVIDGIQMNKPVTFSTALYQTL